MDIAEATSIKALIQGMTPESATVVRGTVESTDPLVIRQANDKKMELREGVLCLPQRLTDYEIELDLSIDPAAVDYSLSLGGAHTHGQSGEAQSGSHGHELALSGASRVKATVRNALKIGDAVFMLSYGYGKRYYILDREA